MFSAHDLQQIAQKGIALWQIQTQLHNFQTGFPFVALQAAATPVYGIKKYNDDQTNDLANYYLQNLKTISTLKFVPASGAATRMFSHLLAFRDATSAQQIQNLQTDNNFNSPAHFLQNMPQFAFFNDLKICMAQQGIHIDETLAQHDYNTLLDCLLTHRGLNYAQLPKALIKFHTYPQDSRTALEEHLVEGANYCFDVDNKVDIHFTLSPEHIAAFHQLLAQVVPTYQQQFHVNFRITHSIQETSTDTIAANEHNQPFRNPDGSLFFRPGGHGALINNLNQITADVVFIKNIDNIVPDRLKPETNRYKMALAGCLLKTRNAVYRNLQMLENQNLSEKILNQIITFAKTELLHTFSKAFYAAPKTEKIKQLFALLNRPIRVCGMVKNQGEPGGGPFLVADAQGNLSLQIIEASQVDMQNPSQKNIMNQATHFNPVDLVCCFKDYKGNKFNLADFVDPSTGFISIKTKDGKPLKAQELPGLWNGAMARWNTLFVEVPIVTFNPVKTVNDLLRREHL
ncbi:MAG: DUF4301 family protein [Bacteroidota bacterium]